MLGSVTVRNICQPEAPSTSAASSSSRPCACIRGISSRATNGKVTNTVASTMPGTAKMILMPCSLSQGTSQPWAPNTSTKTRPEITGDTENGRSIRLIRSCLPRKSNLVMAQAAATPNTRLSGTARTAISSVSWIADRAWRPWSRNGRTRCVRCPALWWLPLTSGHLCCAAVGPALQAVDDEQEGERHHQHDGGDRGGADVVVLLQLGDNDQRGDLRHHGEVTGDEDDRAILADGTCESQREAREQRRQQRRQHHAAHGLPAAGAETGG